MRDASGEVHVDVPVSGGENVMIPVIRAVVCMDGTPDRILLQRRDSPDEAVRGWLEIPGGRWRAGESPEAAIAREVLEETGVTLVSVAGVSITDLGDEGAIASINPLVVAAGMEGAFPASHMVVTAVGSGEPRPEEGETADVRWWSLDEVRAEMARNRNGFIPSSFAALEAYLAFVDAGS